MTQDPMKAGTVLVLIGSLATFGLVLWDGTILSLVFDIDSRPFA
ncbi:MAG: hypothetical protein QXN83_03955 [Nitrososphaerales archaeon]